ncbi:unnamed protein product [Ixodes persulcatus]
MRWQRQRTAVFRWGSHYKPESARFFADDSKVPSSTAAVAVNRNSARWCCIAESAVGTQGWKCSGAAHVSSPQPVARKCNVGSAAAGDTLHSSPRVSHSFAP